MLLAIDAGNTNIVFGIHDGESWIHEWRFNTIPVKSQIDYEMFLRLNFLEANLRLRDVQGVIISSVVPQLNTILAEFWSTLIEAEHVFVGPKHYDQLPITTHNPHEIGTDLIANATAAHLLHEDDTVVVDFGTALTFTVVEASGNIQGVNIAPGLKTAIAALVGNTAQLPDVPLELPDSSIGKNTIHAIQSGVLWGYVSMVEGMLDRIQQELGKKVKVVATGGLSSILHPLHDRFDEVNPKLTLEGLRLIHNIISK
ncbi:MAG: type III pantothenate kinase [Roseivirga sp.]|nr:type III pantothenate kinase [Roseivirga sp.]